MDGCQGAVTWNAIKWRKKLNPQTGDGVERRRSESSLTVLPTFCQEKPKKASPVQGQKETPQRTRLCICWMDFLLGKGMRVQLDRFFCGFLEIESLSRTSHLGLQLAFPKGTKTIKGGCLNRALGWCGWPNLVSQLLEPRWLSSDRLRDKQIQSKVPPPTPWAIPAQRLTPKLA